MGVAVALIRLLVYATLCLVTGRCHCAGGVTQSRVISAAPSGRLRETCPAADTKYRFITADPMTGGLLDICGTPSTPIAFALPTSACGETRIGGLAFVDRTLYYTTGTSVRGFTQDDDWELAGGIGVVSVLGERFGTTDAELVALRLRGVTCRTLRRFSSTHLSCLETHPSVVGPNAQDPLLPTDVEVETTSGGNGTAVSRTLSDLRGAEYADSAAPAVFEVSRLENYALRAVALCAVKDELWVSSLGTPKNVLTGSAGGFGGLIVFNTKGGEARFALKNAPRILGLAFDGRRIYYSDASRGVVASRPVDKFDGEPGDAEDRVHARIREPRGLAFDPDPRRSHDLYVSAGFTIKRVNSSLLEHQDVLDVVFGPHTAAPDGIIVLPPDPGAVRDRALRLVWLDGNRPRFNVATRYGTRQTDLPPQDKTHHPFRFARALALDPLHGHFYVAEWLGRIWRFPSLRADESSVMLVRDDDSTATAPTIRAALDKEDLARRRLQPTLRTYLLP